MKKYIKAVISGKSENATKNQTTHINIM